MRFAIIDCGTNTFHLLIAEKKKDGGFRKIYKSKAVVKLGEGGITDRIIREIPFRRGIDALKKFRQHIDEHDVKNIIAYGTAALRNARNGMLFIDAAKEACGIAPELIRGDREATLIHKGVMLAFPPEDGISLIMDIGGGSTEFILADKHKILWKKSFAAGAALLLEKFQPSDPLKKGELVKINQWYDDVFEPLINSAAKWPPARLIGSSGSFDTFAEMILYKKEGNLNALKGKTSYEFRMQDYSAVQRDILHSTTKERMNMKGLVKMRVDMIVMSAVQLNFVLNSLKIKRMTLSRYALKEGMMAEITSGS
jgi:exopolyphosphatase / guanosine-5'-triphosphate,3'-diphosphate pyrophosphatase